MPSTRQRERLQHRERLPDGSWSDARHGGGDGALGSGHHTGRGDELGHVRLQEAVAGCELAEAEVDDPDLAVGASRVPIRLPEHHQAHGQTIEGVPTW